VPGIGVTERAISHYRPERPADPEADERWMVFLRDHRVVPAAMGVFTFSRCRRRRQPGK
jgi:hypothetical protein